MAQTHPSNAADHAARPVPGRTPLLLALAVAAVVIVADQLTKQWAVNRLEPGRCTGDGGCIDVFWTLRFHLSFNPGAAFSNLQSGGEVLALIAIAMSTYLFVLAYRTTDRWLPWLFGLVAGGAIGNLADRIFRAEDGPLSGEVVDFIDFQFWPIFNIADMAVVGGVIALASRLWWIDRHPDAPITDDVPTAESTEAGV